MVVNPPTIVQVLTWIGFNTSHKRGSVTSYFVYATEGLAHSVIKDDYGIDAGCHNYHKRVISRWKFNMNIIKVQRLKSLMYWVQDCHRYQENCDFPDINTKQQLLNKVNEYLQRHGMSKNCSETGK